jgi:hypothetical protein
MKRIYTALILALAIGTSVNSMAYAAKSFDQEQQTAGLYAGSFRHG